MTGRNLLPLLLDEPSAQSSSDADFSYTVTSFERHVLNARENNQTCPTRALHTKDFVYIRNFAAEHWPVGDPPTFRDIDGTSPSKIGILGNAEYLEITTAKRPVDELYNIPNDPYQLNNLAARPEFDQTKLALADLLQQVLADSDDPVISGDVNTFIQHPYYGVTDPPSSSTSN
jgi:N-sulfoglucosamine sulfohydrolase